MRDEAAALGHPPSTRARNRLEMRRRILKAARQTFLEMGTSQADLGRIARLAGVGRATLYRHFDGKDALVIGLAEQDWHRQVRWFETLVEQPVIDHAILIQWLRETVELAIERAASFRFFYAEGQDMLGSRLAGQHDRLLDVLARRFHGCAGPEAADRMEGRFLVYQLEQFLRYAATVAQPAEVERGIRLLADRMAGRLIVPPAPDGQNR